MTGKAAYFLEATTDGNKLNIGFYERHTSS